MLRKIYKFLASLTLALILLTVIIVATIIGTVCEQRLDAEVARHYIYNAPWFNVWLSMLVVNLLCVATIRYPWKGYQTGFVITHFGIITLLLGGMIDRIWGIEGYLRLNRGDEPTRTMELHEQELRVGVSGAGKEATPFQLKVLGMKSPLESVIGKVTKSDDSLLKVKSPSPDVKVSVLDVKAVHFGLEPEVSLTIQGPMMGRHNLTISLNETKNLMSMAQLRFLPGMPPGQRTAPRLERYFAFAKYGNLMGSTLFGDPTSVTGSLAVDDTGENPVLRLEMFEKTIALPIKKSEMQKPLPLEGLPDWKITIKDYYRNLRMDGKQPVDVAGKAENPAVLFELTGPDVTAIEKLPESHTAAETPPNLLTVYLGDDGALRYHIKSRRKGEFVGSLEADQTEKLEWAPGTEFKLNKYTKGDNRKLLWKPLDDDESGGMTDAMNRGLLCRVTVGSDSKEVWIGQLPVDTGDPMFKPYIEQRTVTTNVGGKEVSLSYSNRSVELPFTVALMKFEAPEDEGMEGSQSYVDFKSTLSFAGRMDTVKLKPDSPTAKELGRTELNGAILDLTHTEMRFQFIFMKSPLTIDRAEITDYTWLTQKISMNRPTSFPVSTIGPWIGKNYKFSQADHNPEMPDFSGVQVLRDPGWMPKWVGCLMICIGIFTMFYIKPYFQGRKAAQVAAALKEKSKSKDPESAKNAKLQPTARV